MLLPRFPLGLTSSPMNAQWVYNLPVSLLEINLISQSTVLDNTVTEITWVYTSTPRHTSNTNEPPPPTPEQYDTLLFRVPQATAFLWANTELGWGGGQWGGEPPYDFLAKHKRGNIWIQNRLSYLGERSELRGALRIRGSSRALLARLLFTISPKWRACSQDNSKQGFFPKRFVQDCG